MASTFSPSLRIELIGDGDQSGIWGQTTNTNLGTLIEQAIAGVVTITMTDATYTLTNFNGVSDEARNQVIVATGALSQQRNIIAPLVEKTYTIKNSTTGGFGVQIIGSSGTGVVIPNGATASVYCDGINFFPMQVNTIGNQTINGNLSVTGTTTLTGALTASSGSFAGVLTAPTAAPGTSTTQVATTAFVQNVAGTLGTMSQQNANNVNITGGVIGGAVTGSTQSVSTSNTTLATTAFVRSIIPAGVILMWSGSVGSIPAGWLLCDGTSGTPDLRDRFIVGAGSSYAVGATGGANTNTLSTAQLPSHTHSISGSGTTSGQSNGHTHTFSGTTSGQSQTHTHSAAVFDPGHSHTFTTNRTSKSGNATPFMLSDPNIGENLNGQGTYGTSAVVTNIAVGIGDASQDHSHTYSGTTSDVSTGHTHTFSFSGTSGAAGSGSSIENRPPYYALAYIMKS